MVNFEQKMNGSQHRSSPVAGLASQAASVLGDAILLAELQAKLAKADAKLAAKRIMGPALLLLLAGCGVLAGLPVLALGLAAALSFFAELESWQSMLIVGGILFVGAILTMLIAARGIQKSFTQFQRSSNELAKNVVWLKTIVGTAPEHSPQLARN